MKKISLLVCSLLYISSYAQNKIHITYLYNSGWIIDSKEYVVVIDYVPEGEHNFRNLIEDKVSLAQRESRDVYVMITHEHKDHFDPEILRLKEKFPEIKYIFGWEYNGVNDNYFFLTGRDSLSLPNFKIYAHPSTDLGSGFVFKIHNTTIYHAGDHAQWTVDTKDRFEQELKYIKSKESKIDIAFFPVARGKFVNCKTDDVMFSGAYNSIGILNPATTFPMHMGCNDFVAYKQFKNYVLSKDGNREILLPEKYGQSFTLSTTDSAKD